MSAFVDETHCEVRSGDGGSGSTSFRREKYVPRGGPDGGDGGKGGDVVFITKKNLATLAHLRGNRMFKARSGENGRGRRMHGKNGEDATICVPPGTVIRDAQSGEILHDFPKDLEGERWVCLPGGEGGLGNWHFRTSRNQSPSYAQNGRPGASLAIVVELALIADVGLVGMPSAGKSSLINAITSSQSKIGAYPFTTRIPNLGMLRRGGTEVLIADIPGLIAGASGGAGLGFQFLRHIRRSASLAFLADLGEEDPISAILTLEAELAAFDSTMEEKKRIIVGTKTDLAGTESKLTALRAAFPADEVFGISVFSRSGLDALADRLLEQGAEVR